MAETMQEYVERWEEEKVKLCFYLHPKRQAKLEQIFQELNEDAPENYKGGLPDLLNCIVENWIDNMLFVSAKKMT